MFYCFISSKFRPREPFLPWAYNNLFFLSFGMTSNAASRLSNSVILASLSSSSAHNKLASKCDKNCRTNAHKCTEQNASKKANKYTHLRSGQLPERPAQSCPFSRASFCSTYILLKSRLNPVDNTGSSTTSICNLLTSLSNAS